MPLDRETLEREFPVVRNTIFLNHAGVSPVSTRVAETMSRFWEVLSHEGPVVVRRKLPGLAQGREAVSRFFNCSPEEVAFVSRTTEGVNIVAQGIDWKPGDNVVVPETEYPATVYPWMNLAEKGVEVRWVPERELRYPVDAVMDAVDDRTRAVSVSFVEFASGYRFPLADLGAACREKNVLYLVDTMQGSGVFPVDMEACNIDAIFCGVHKWIMGPTGVALFVCRKELMNRLRVLYVGADSVVDADDYLEYDLTLREDAARFEYGMVNYAGIAGISSALELMEELGIENIRQGTREITDYLVEGLRSRGLRVHSPRGESEWSGIVSCTHPQVSSVDLNRALLREDITTVVRGGMLRISPAYYNTEAQIDKVLDVLDRSARDVAS